MPPNFVDSVADKVDGLSQSEAENIWDEVKTSMQDEGELPDSEDDFDEQSWRLLNDAFQSTIASRFDVSKSDLTESRILPYLEGKDQLESLFEPSDDESSVIEHYVMTTRQYIDESLDADINDIDIDGDEGDIEFYQDGRRFELEFSIRNEQPYVELEHMVIDRPITDLDDIIDELREVFNE